MIVGTSTAPAYPYISSDFIYNQGSFTTLTTDFGISGINNSNNLVGGSQSGLAFFLSNSQSQIQYLGNGTARGINDNGVIVGYDGTHGFIVNNGSYTLFDEPNAASYYGFQVTDANGINNNGEIVGIYSDALGNIHAFIDNNGVFTDFNIAGAHDNQFGRDKRQRPTGRQLY